MEVVFSFRSIRDNDDDVCHAEVSERPKEEAWSASTVSYHLIGNWLH